MLGSRLQLAVSALMMGKAAMAAVHVVTVGKGDHDFTPKIVYADPGDIVSFQFFPQNHSVVRMDPDYPCIPWETYNFGKGSGWWSHFYPVDTPSANPPTWNITVNDTLPFYYYCSQVGSCITYEMVGAVNPPNSTYVEQIATRAGQADFALSPGEAIPSDSTATPTPSSSNTNNSSGVTLSVGAIAGIVIGAVCALALIGLLFFFVGRKKKGTEMKEKTAATPEDGLMGTEHPPVYQDPRYSVVPAGAAANQWDNKPVDPRSSGVPMSENSHRISELPDSSTYDPVEIYTPGPEDMPAHRR
ncbi:hypothetical protein DFP73DRAFT_565044 [Morchella snyderi]|nr:hypothetical protein DFP73DRAFT_565044 [Morchella snyderi]